MPDDRPNRSGCDHPQAGRSWPVSPKQYPLNASKRGPVYCPVMPPKQPHYSDNALAVLVCAVVTGAAAIVAYVILILTV